MTPGTGSSQLLAFIKFLRSKDVPVSPADTLDAVHAAGLLGYEDRTKLRDGLAAVLAKSTFEQSAYLEAFDLFFAPQHPDDKTSEGPEAENSASESTQTDAQNNPSTSTESTPSLDDLLQNPSAQDDPTLAGLMSSDLMNALQDGDESTLAMAIEAAAEAARIDEIRLFTQRGQFTRKLLDALGETALRDAAIELEGNQPKAFQEIQRLRESLRHRARDRVERAYLVHAAGDTEDFLDEALSEVRLANISPHQMARMRKLMDRMARKLASRHGRRRRKKRRGQLNVPMTLRASVATDGIPFNTHWRQIQKKRPQVMAICDVSGSVATYAKFLLMFLYALQDVLPRTRSFAFSSSLGEVTDWFSELSVEEAVSRVNRVYGGATDYARALSDFNELALQDINKATTVIILGDARNNNSDLRLDLLAEIKAKCKRLIWLNPEPRLAWGTGDSAMLPVTQHCHLATECNNLKQLERIIDTLLSAMHGN